jgi:hypothetical protein
MDVDISHASTPVPADPGELISTVPHVLGIHPDDSIVVVGLDEDGVTSSIMLRADLPTRGEYGELAVHLLMPLLANDSAAAVLIVVGGTDTDPTQALPHRELISGCTARFASRDLPVPHRFWAASTITGSDWRSYDNPECAGNVLDSGGSAIACACAAEGKNKYGRREDLAAALAPVAEQVLAQRADLLSAASTSGEDSSAVGLLDWSLSRPGWNARHRGPFHSPMKMSSRWPSRWPTTPFGMRASIWAVPAETQQVSCCGQHWSVILPLPSGQKPQAC